MSETGERLREGDLMTVPQVLRLVPISKSALYELAAEGILPSFRAGAPGSRRGRLLFWRGDIEVYVARARQAATRAPARPDADGVLAKVRARGRGLAAMAGR
jgi:hypothetical protein